MMNIPVHIISDIGIVYDDVFRKDEFVDDIISCTMTEKGQMLFCDRRRIYLAELSDDSIEIIHHADIVDTNVVGVCAFESYYYCLTYKEKKTVVYKYSFDFQLEDEFTLMEDGIPLCICSGDSIYIGFYKGYYKCYDSSLKMLSEKSLTEYGVVAPTYIQALSDGCLITDEYMNVLCEITKDCQVTCMIGELDNNEVIYRPYCGTKTERNTYLFCERRNHLVSEYNSQGKCIWQYGQPGRAGIELNRLWDPIGVWEYKDNYLVVLGQGRCFILVSKDKSSFRLLYGQASVVRTDLNYPRTCDYQDETNSLLVANTALNEIIIYSENKKQILTKAGGREFNNPRMARWYEKGILVADTRNSRIVYWENNGNEKIYDLKCYGLNDWILGFDICKESNNVLLIYKKYILILSMNDASIIWDSRILQHTFRDLHQAEWFDENHIAVANTGENEIVLVDIRDNSYKSFHTILYEDEAISLKNPRLIIKIDNHVYLINSAKSDIYELDLLDMQRVKRRISLSEDCIFSHSCLRYPRWICRGQNNVLFITDTENQRVVMIDSREE